MGSVVEQAERESGCGGRLPQFSLSTVESEREPVAHSDGASGFDRACSVRKKEASTPRTELRVWKGASVLDGGAVDGAV